MEISMSAISIKTNQQVIDNTNPVIAYMSDKSRGSIATIKGSLQVVTLLLTKNESNDFLALEWHTLTPEIAMYLRTKLSERYEFNSANKTLSFVRGIFDKCHELGLVEAERYLRVKAVLKNIKGQKVLTGRRVTPEEIDQLTKSCPATPKGIRDSAILWIMYSCALRRAEVANLQMNDLDLEQRLLKVAGAKGNKTQDMRLSDRVEGYLRDWLHVRGSHEGSLFVGVKKSGQLTHSITDRGIADILHNLQEEAGVKPFVSHDFRRSAITMVLENYGVGVAQTYARHSDPKTTLAYNRSINRDNDLKKASELF